MNLNKIIIIAFVALIVLGSVAIFLVLRDDPAGPADGQKTIQTAQGPITVNDYTQNPVETTNDVFVMEETPDYKITNFKIDDSFLMTLLSKPLKDARAKAEQAFLNKLNITQEQACTVNVSVKIPLSVDETYAGQELGLSFCPNAVVLP